MGYQSFRPDKVLPFLLTILFLADASLPLRAPAYAYQRSLSRASALSEQFQTVSPGIEYLQITRGQASQDLATGPWFINLLRVDPQHARLKVFHALDEGVGLETVSSIAARHKANAAINGGYFSTSGTFRGEPVGTLMLEGKLISEPYNERSAIGFIENAGTTEIVFGHLKFSAKVSTGQASHTVDGVNRPLSLNELIVFTPQFHRTTLTTSEGLEVVVRSGKVITLRDHQGSSEIPSDGYVVSAVGSAREWLVKNIKRGSKISFSSSLSPINDKHEARWRLASTILGCGPQLIRGGKIAITDKEEKMAAGFATDRHPRSAIARLDSGKLLLVTVDGRQPGVSVGISLNMLADLLLEFGAVEAVNLDGGGSTTMFVRDKVVNRPSDQTGERPVSDAILIFSKGN
jgi:exopolysaccharide biosynthesis protein